MFEQKEIRDERINRRAGIDDAYQPFKYPIGSSLSRHHRRQLVKLYGRGGYVNHYQGCW
jgi:hypothetical protein